MWFQTKGETQLWNFECDVPPQCVKLKRALERVKKFASIMHSNALHHYIS